MWCHKSKAATSSRWSDWCPVAMFGDAPPATPPPEQKGNNTAENLNQLSVLKGARTKNVLVWLKMCKNRAYRKVAAQS